VRASGDAVPAVSSEGDKSLPASGVGAGTNWAPKKFEDIVQAASEALRAAREDGETRVEVEFPPFGDGEAGYKEASDSYIDANMQIAIAMARLVSRKRSVHIVVPDSGELNRTLGMFGSALDTMPELSIGSLSEANLGVDALFQKVTGLFDPQQERKAELLAKQRSAEDSDLVLVVNCSAVELPYIREAVEGGKWGKDKPVVLVNLELDTLRADLGLPSFPPKALHYEFLSTFKPVFYIRARDYSKTLPKAPFQFNYSGAVFRKYPGPWECLLREDAGNYRSVAQSEDRYPLGQMKEELLNALGLAEREGSAMEFLTRGYTNTTWWEQDIDKEKSGRWRT